MSLVSSLAIFFVIWWLVLFAVLPFGVRSQHEMDDVTFGTERGAPHQPLLLRKFAATTLIAAILFAAVYLYFGVLDLSLADLAP